LSYGLLLGSRPFDIVVGNPPYISFGLRAVGKISKRQFKYFKEKYPNSAEYKISMYAMFLNRGIELLGEHGRLGFVVPDSFLLADTFPS
jgi:adenine-specific DNA methylase